MAKEWLTDEQVEQEIDKLRGSYYVKLARDEERIRYKRRKYLYTLRHYDQKGRALEKAGITPEVLKAMENDE